MKRSGHLRLADELLMLDRGQDELLLANGTDVRPLYIRKGKAYIQEFLRVVAELGTTESILDVYPHEQRLLDLMMDHAILVPHESARRNRQPTNAREGLAPDKKEGMSLYLLISQSCNMGCVYCLNGRNTYQTDRRLRMSREIAFKTVERCLDNIVEEGRLEINFFGGEPLLNWPLAKEVMIHCERCLREKHKRQQRQYHFTSNLSFLPSDLIEWAKRFDISFLCDVDGPPAIHNACRPFKDGRGTYEDIAANIRRIREAGLKIDLRATVTALNQDRLLEVAEEHKALGGRSSAFVPVNPVNSDESILSDTLLPSAETVIAGMAEVYRSKVWKHGELFPFNQYAPRLVPGSRTVLGCGAPCGNIAVVDVNGDVYPCIYLVGIGKFHIGNIMDGSYPRRDVLERMYSDLHVDHMEDCRGCSWRYMCGGGCPLGRLTVQDNPLAGAEVKAYCRKIRCDYTKSIFEVLLWDRARDAASEHTEGSVHAPRCR